MYVPTWGGLSPATMCFNEALTNGFLVQPSNAWTNAAYVLVAVFLLVVYRRNNKRRLLYAFTAVSFLVGITSFLYHASNSFLFQVFDLSSMYLLGSLLLTLNIARLSGKDDIKRDVIIYMVIFILSLIVLLSIRGRIGAVIFAIEAAAVLVLELVIWLRKKIGADYRDWMTTLALLILSFVFWLLDFNHLLFPPNNHLIQGHGIWHILNSLCFIFLYRFYGRFEIRKKIHGKNKRRFPDRESGERRSLST